MYTVYSSSEVEISVDFSNYFVCLNASEVQTTSYWPKLKSSANRRWSELPMSLNRETSFKNLLKFPPLIRRKMRSLRKSRRGEAKKSTRGGFGRTEWGGRRRRKKRQEFMDENNGRWSRVWWQESGDFWNVPDVVFSFLLHTKYFSVAMDILYVPYAQLQMIVPSPPVNLR